MHAPEPGGPHLHHEETQRVVTTHQTEPQTTVERAEAVTTDPYAPRRAAAEKLTQGIWLLFGLIIGLIAIRVVLKLLGANPDAPFAELIYGITAVFLAPFVGLFGTLQAQRSVFEPHALVAIVVYALLGWLLVQLAWLIWGETRSAVATRTFDSRSRT